MVYCLYSIGENYLNNRALEEELTNVFSPLLEFIMASLNATAERSEWDSHKLRFNAYEAIQVYVSLAADDCLPLIVNFLQMLMRKLNESLQTPLTTEDLKDEHLKLQAWLCATLLVVVRKLGKRIEPHVSNIMTLMLRVIESNSTALEEALLVVDGIADITEDGFNVYMRPVYAHLIAGLSNANSYSHCSICIGLTGDIARAIGPSILPYCDEIMDRLLHTLVNKTANRGLKPLVIGAFMEIAMAIESEFEKYIPTLMPMLAQASEVRVTNQEDDEFVEYVHALQEAILEAYTGILSAFGQSQKVNNIMPFMVNIFLFLKLLVSVDAFTSIVILNIHVTVSLLLNIIE